MDGLIFADINVIIKSTIKCLTLVSKIARYGMKTD